MSGATAGLREEHQLILRVVASLEENVESPPGGQSDLGVVEDCVSFFKLFVDACHHGKEEDLLFGELVGAGMPRHAGPIAVMLEEHQRGRALVKRMAEVLEEAQRGRDGAYDALRAVALDYAELIRSHIAKEDGVLFNHADHVLGAPACERLCAGYEVVCARRFDGCTKAQLEELAERIISRS